MEYKVKTEQTSWFVYRQLTALLVAVQLVIYALLYINSDHRYKSFVSSQYQMMNKSAADTAQKLSTYIAKTRQTVELFTDTKTELITYLSRNPQDEEAREKLANALQRDVPGYFAFTLADETGRPVLDDFDGEISKICLLDLKGFAERWHPSELLIHPNSLQYHFDIMMLVDFGEDDQTIFLVSFKPDEIVKLLADDEVDSHKIMLLHQSKNQLIELTAHGTRDMLKRNINLSDDELNSIRIEYSVPESLWLLVYLPDTELFEEKKQYFRTQALQISVAVFFLGVVLMVFIRRKKKTMQR